VKTAERGIADETVTAMNAVRRASRALIEILRL
jgi:hypothetical protein